MTKQVQLSDDAYKLLKARKRSGESFSDVIHRLAGPKKSPMALVGRRLVPASYDRVLARMDEADRARAQRLERRRRLGRR